MVWRAKRAYFFFSLPHRLTGRSFFLLCASVSLWSFFRRRYDRAMEAARWADFSGFVIVQAVVFVALAGWQRKSLRAITRILLPSLICGLPIGFAFDLLIGRARDVFAYDIAPSWLFFAVNGFFSYGLALATAALFPPAVVRTRAPRWRRVAVIAGLALAGAIAAALFPATALARMVAAGCLVVGAGEVAAALARRSGPLGTLLAADAVPFLRFWRWSASLGLIYEVANAVLPVWRWSLSATLPLWTSELFIVAFGYFVLFHPLALAWQSFGEERGEGRAADDLVERQ
jgi:hypothetical protein